MVKNHFSYEFFNANEKRDTDVAPKEAPPKSHEVKKDAPPPPPSTKEREAQKPKEKVEDKTPKAEKEAPKSTPEQQQEKRHEIIERSLALKKQFEEAPIPRDPHVVARLVVAEHILALHEQIQNPEEVTNKVKGEELEAALEYMGELAEKLEDPSIETSPSITAAYETIIQLADEALEDTPPDTIITLAHEELQQAPHPTEPYVTASSLNASSSTKESKTADAQPSYSSARLFVATITQLQQHAVSATKIPISNPVDSSSSPQNSSGYSGSYNPPTPTTMSRPIPAVEARSIHQPTLERSRVRPNVFAPIAAIALTATLGKRHHSTESYTPSSSPERTSSFSPSPHIPARERTIPLQPAETPPATIEARPSLASPLEIRPLRIRETAPYTPAHSSEQPPLVASRKIEHLPLHSLLSMAESVSLGQGQYLRDVFEHNKLDKEGLIKVLKARAKGKDFVVEFQNQAARFKAIKSSPEFLHTTLTPSLAMPMTNDQLEPAQKEGETPPPSSPIGPIPSISPTINNAKQIIKPSSPVLKEAETPDTLTLAWIVAILIALGILAAMLMYLF